MNQSTRVQSSQQEIILIADPRILAIPVHENHEPMIDLLNQQEIIYGPSPEIPNNTDYTKLRITVFEKLKQAQALLPKGLRFCLYEGYRSLKLQETLFNARLELVRLAKPDATHEDLFIETTRLVSPVINLDGTKNIPPHASGAALDVYLLDAAGNALDMGIHPEDWLQDVSGVLSQTNSTLISQAARRNRTIMSEVLSAVGFVNYPTEYWHWSYGDRYWAYFSKQDHAIYGVI